VEASALINVVNVPAADGRSGMEGYAVYATPLIDEVESELVAQSLADGKRIGLGAATTFEWGVHSVFFDSSSRQFVLTATADLTEMVLRYDLSGNLLSSEEPYPYNDRVFLVTAYPAGKGQEIHLEAPEELTSAWSESLFVDGEFRARRGFEPIDGTPTGWFDATTSAEGQLLVQTDAGGVVVTTYGNALQIRPVCERPAQQRLPR
jgi:hypothetical protein